MQNALGVEIVYIDIDEISTDKRAKQSSQGSSQERQIVKMNVRLYTYDDDAPPLLVFPHPTVKGNYQLLKGYKRMDGARENGSIKQLPCVIVKAKNLAEARLMANRYNAPVHDVRERKNLATHVIEALDKSYKSRSLTKDLSISKDELSLLASLSGESTTTCNRALAVFRSIFSEQLAKKPDCADGGHGECFLAAIDSGDYPELKSFYEENISVLSFTDRHTERINQLSAGEKRKERQL